VSERDDDQVIDRVAAELRRPVRLGPAFDAQVMARVKKERPALRTPQSASGGPAKAWRWLTRPRTVRVSPLAGLAVAAGLAAVMVIGRRGPAVSPVAAGESTSAPNAQVRTVGAHPSSINPGPSTLEPRPSTLVQFLLVAPGARHVTLVGDFNDWDVGATPLVSAASGRVWTIEVPLTPGRHRYAFVVDGTRWLADPTAPRALGDDFGTPSSVVTVTERGV
jgi:hypothetical protein